MSKNIKKTHKNVATDHLSHRDTDVCWPLARLSSLPFTLQGHGDLLWLVLIQQREALQQLLLHRHLLGFTCHCDPESKTSTYC